MIRNDLPLVITVANLHEVPEIQYGLGMKDFLDHSKIFVLVGKEVMASLETPPAMKIRGLRPPASVNRPQL